jgi:DnaJ-class molecular chaperone
MSFTACSWWEWCKPCNGTGQRDGAKCSTCDGGKGSYVGPGARLVIDPTLIDLDTEGTLEVPTMFDEKK